MALITESSEQFTANWRHNPGWVSGNCPCVVNGQSPTAKAEVDSPFEDDKFHNCFNCGYKTGWSPARD